MYTTIASILAARTMGYTARSILKRLGKTNPKFEKVAQVAEAAGFSSPMVLSRLFKDKKGHKDAEEFMTEHEKTKLADKRTKRKAAMGLLKTAVGVGAAAYGGYKLASRGLARGSTALMPRQELPPEQVTGSRYPELTRQAAVTPPEPNIPPPFGGKPNEPQRAPFTPEQQERQQGLEKLQGVAENLPSELENQYPYLPIFVRKHIQAGVAPEEIYGNLQKSKMLAPVIKKIEEQTGAPYLDRINHIAGMVKGKDQGIAPTPIKSQEVITPRGPGVVHKVHGDNAYVEVDNKLHKVPLESVEQPSEDVVEAVSRMLNIEEVDKSNNVALFVYDPEESKAMFQFHDGTFYKYLQVPPDLVKEIAEKNATPITEGQNVYGQWSPDDPHGSLGGALWKYMLKDPRWAQVKKKGEPANPNYKKLDVKYDYWTGLRKKKKR